MKGKGRDKDLVRLRDNDLYRVYYNLTEIERLREDDTLEILERWFYISQATIVAKLKKIAHSPPEDLTMPKIELPKRNGKFITPFTTRR